eukprot:gene9859-10907_t
MNREVFELLSSCISLISQVDSVRQSFHHNAHQIVGLAESTSVFLPALQLLREQPQLYHPGQKVAFQKLWAILNEVLQHCQTLLPGKFSLSFLHLESESKENTETTRKLEALLYEQAQQLPRLIDLELKEVDRLTQEEIVSFIYRVDYLVAAYYQLLAKQSSNLVFDDIETRKREAVELCEDLQKDEPADVLKEKTEAVHETLACLRSNVKSMHDKVMLQFWPHSVLNENRELPSHKQASSSLVDHNHNSLEILPEAKAILVSGDVYTWASQGNAAPLELLWDLHCLSALKGVGERYTYQMEAWQSPEKVPPLIIAAGLGHAHFVELLLRHPEVDVNDSDDEYGWTALHCASDKGHVDTVLLSEGLIDTNRLTKSEESALYLASCRGYAAVVQTLLDDYRVDPNLTKNTWSSPLQFAVDIGRISVVQVFTACPRLLINHQTRRGYCPIDIVCGGYLVPQDHKHYIMHLLKARGALPPKPINSHEIPPP